MNPPATGPAWVAGIGCVALDYGGTLDDPASPPTDASHDVAPAAIDVIRARSATPTLDLTSAPPGNSPPAEGWRRLSSVEEQADDTANQEARNEAPLLREAYPALSRELISLLEAGGERDLAICARDLRIVTPCECKDEFCQSFYTAPPPGGPFGPGHRNVALNPERGMLILDVVNNRIMYVEVLYYPPLSTMQAT